MLKPYWTPLTFNYNRFCFKENEKKTKKNLITFLEFFFRLLTNMENLFIYNFFFLHLVSLLFE